MEIQYYLQNMLKHLNHNYILGNQLHKNYYLKVLLLLLKDLNNLHYMNNKLHWKPAIRQLWYFIVTIL